MTKLALSTAWNAFRHRDAKAIVEEIKSIGFNSVELNFSLPKKIIEDIALLQKTHQIEVVSLHNYCPLPEGQSPFEASPDNYSLAALDEWQRIRAIRNTKETIDTANRLKAKAVVLHAGRVEMPEITKTLIRIYKSGGKDSQEFKRIKDEFIKERRSKIRPHLDAVLKSIDELAGYAQEAKIYLGIETRFYYREIPSFDEIEIILKNFKNSSVFYWHDVGHAQVMENLGFFKHRDYLERYAKSLIGIHIHGIKGCDDHLAPFDTDLDLNMVVTFIKKDTLKVVESHSNATKDDLIKARDKLGEIFSD
jgi:sugar phosphate isomerase/epimerase